MKQSIRQNPYRQQCWWLGMGLVSMLTLFSFVLSQFDLFKRMQFGTLTLGIIVGILVGNSVFPRLAIYTSSGVDFSKSILLKAGVILFGFRVTFSQVADVGWQGFIIDVVMLMSTFILAMLLGRRVFKLDQQTTILIGAGSAICGAAAIMATESLIKAQAHKVSVAVATVVVFGTLSMFIYPLLFNLIGLSEHAYGVYVGSTIHEVAQVVAAGSAVSADAGSTAVIEKMLRVMLLAPFLMCLSYWQGSRGNVKEKHNSGDITIPWFAVLFIVASAIHSMAFISQYITNIIVYIDNVLLTAAMVALGLRTHISAIRQAGIKPLLLASCLFVFLSVGGYLINVAIAKVF